MVIIYIYQYFKTRDRPGGTRSFEMAKRLTEMGHEVHVITSERELKSNKERAWIETAEEGIHVHWYPVPYSNEMTYMERIGAFFKFAFHAAAKSASIESDVVFATSTPLTIAIPAVYTARKRKVPMVLEVRDLWPEIPIAVGALRNPVSIWAAKMLESFAYRNANHIVALSPGMKEGIEAAGYPAERINIIPNSSDLDLFFVDDQSGRELRSQYSWLQERPLVIYTGTVGLINGIDYFVRLAAEVYSINREVRFLVIGSGREEGKVRNLAIELGIFEKNFFLLPSIPKSEIPMWLSAADVATSFVIDLPVLWMNSANKFFDALAAGKPVVLNYRGWQAELLQEYGCGLILHPKDISKAADILAESIMDKDWLSRAGRLSRKLARERFSRDKLARELEEVLLKVVEENPKTMIR